MKSQIFGPLKTEHCARPILWVVSLPFSLGSSSYLSLRSPIKKFQKILSIERWNLWKTPIFRHFFMYICGILHATTSILSYLRFFYLVMINYTHFMHRWIHLHSHFTLRLHKCTIWAITYSIFIQTFPFKFLWFAMTFMHGLRSKTTPINLKECRSL